MLREALQRDVRPATTIIRALHDLRERHGLAGTVEERGGGGAAAGSDEEEEEEGDESEWLEGTLVVAAGNSRTQAHVS